MSNLNSTQRSGNPGSLSVLPQHGRASALVGALGRALDRECRRVIDWDDEREARRARRVLVRL